MSFRDTVEMPEEYTGKPIQVLIDGDIPAYRAAAATDGKMYKCQDKSYHKTKKSAEAKTAWLGATSDTIECQYTPEPLENAIHNMDTMIKGALRKISDHYRRPVVPQIFISGSGNFRNEVYPKYKESRKKTRKPENLKGCKQHLVDHWDADYVNGYEADDLLSIHSYALEHKDCIIVSVDKDLLQIPGEHYNLVKEEFTTIQPSEGRHLFWTQVLTGDKTDDIEGLHGIGPKKAQVILADVKGWGNEQDYFKVVHAAYLKHYPKEEGESEYRHLSRVMRKLSTAARLLHLVRDYEMPWEIPPWEPYFPDFPNDIALQRDLAVAVYMKSGSEVARLVKELVPGGGTLDAAALLMDKQVYIQKEPPVWGKDPAYLYDAAMKMGAKRPESPSWILEAEAARAQTEFEDALGRYRVADEALESVSHSLAKEAERDMTSRIAAYFKRYMRKGE